MTLAERLSTPTARRRGGQTCKVGALLQGLDREDYDALEKVLRNRDWPAVDITDALRDEGHDIKVHQVRWHRRGKCTFLSCAAHDTGYLR